MIVHAPSMPSNLAPAKSRLCDPLRYTHYTDLRSFSSYNFRSYRSLKLKKAQIKWGLAWHFRFRRLSEVKAYDCLSCNSSAILLAIAI